VRFPWQRRADEERGHRMAAQERLASARADWVTVHAHAADLRREKNLNGWTGIVDALFADRKEGGRR
jgi:hypothetical protein